MAISARVRSGIQPATYGGDQRQYVPRVYPDGLHSDFLATTFSLPHVSVPAPVARVAGPIVVGLDLEGARHNFVVTTRPVQQSKTSLSGLRRKIGRIYHLVNRTANGNFSQEVCGDKVERAWHSASTNIFAFSRERRWNSSFSPLPGDTASIKRGSSWGVNVP